MLPSAWRVTASPLSPTVVILVRHGHVVDNDPHLRSRLCGWTDPPLSVLGQAQAERVAGALALHQAPAALYCSSLRRARDTAVVIGERLGLDARVRDSLREINCGQLDGWPVADVRRTYPDLWARNMAQENDEFAWPGGETYLAFRRRVLAALRRIVAAHPGDRVLIVTHAGVITQIVGALSRTRPARWEAHRVGNASITEVRWFGRTGSVERFDVRDHLNGLAERLAAEDAGTPAA